MEIIAASLSLKTPYPKTVQSLDIAAASLSVVSISSRGSFISMSLIASKGYVQVIDLIKGVTVTNS